MKKRTVEEVVRSLGGETYRRGKPFHGKEVYIPNRDKYKGLYIGMPHVVIVDENGARKSTQDELIEYMNAGGFRGGHDIDDKFS